ncbi:MAG: GNAT family N-acetyltransferase [Pyrinomonadaceae bacterium]
MESRDVPGVLELLREFAEYEKLSQYCTATEERFQAALFGEGSFANGIVALSGDEIAGYAIFYPNFSTFRGERGMYLEDIYIRPAFRGGGTGKMMLQEVARCAAGRGFERIDFLVLDWNTPAIEFYKRLGAECNEDETHFKFAGEAFAELSGSGV